MNRPPICRRTYHTRKMEVVDLGYADWIGLHLERRSSTKLSLQNAHIASRDRAGLRQDLTADTALVWRFRLFFGAIKVDNGTCSMAVYNPDALGHVDMSPDHSQEPCPFVLLYRWHKFSEVLVQVAVLLRCHSIVNDFVKSFSHVASFVDGTRSSHSLITNGRFC